MLVVERGPLRCSLRSRKALVGACITDLAVVVLFQLPANHKKEKQMNVPLKIPRGISGEEFLKIEKALTALANPTWLSTLNAFQMTQLGQMSVAFNKLTNDLGKATIEIEKMGLEVGKMTTDTDFGGLQGIVTRVEERWEALLRNLAADFTNIMAIVSKEKE